MCRPEFFSMLQKGKVNGAIDEKRLSMSKQTIAEAG